MVEEDQDGTYLRSEVLSIQFQENLKAWNAWNRSGCLMRFERCFLMSNRKGIRQGKVVKQMSAGALNQATDRETGMHNEPKRLQDPCGPIEVCWDYTAVLCSSFTLPTY